MLSLIICSRKSNISIELQQNIQTTIGVEYELVIVDNSKNQYSIFQAYNLGVSRAKYPYLCFMHDDILFNTLDWGKKTIAYFEDTKVGVIGVSGGHCIYDTPSSWWHSHIVSENYVQRNLQMQDGKDCKISFYNHKHKNKTTEQVVAIDGFWFCSTKKLFSEIQFDELTFKSFHFYDLDICFQIRELGYTVHVIYDVLIEHFSQGSTTNEWINNSILFNNKWKHRLPIIEGVKLSQLDYISLCTKHVENQLSYIRQLNQSEERLQNLLNSKAYRLGKFILNPFSAIRKYINK